MRKLKLNGVAGYISADNKVELEFIESRINWLEGLDKKSRFESLELDSFRKIYNGIKSATDEVDVSEWNKVNHFSNFKL